MDGAGSQLSVCDNRDGVAEDRAQNPGEECSVGMWNQA